MAFGSSFGLLAKIRFCSKRVAGSAQASRL